MSMQYLHGISQDICISTRKENDGHRLINNIIGERVGKGGRRAKANTYFGNFGSPRVYRVLSPTAYFATCFSFFVK